MFSTKLWKMSLGVNILTLWQPPGDELNVSTRWQGPVQHVIPHLSLISAHFLSSLLCHRLIRDMMFQKWLLRVLTLAVDRVVTTGCTASLNVIMISTADKTFPEKKSSSVSRKEYWSGCSCVECRRRFPEKFPKEISISGKWYGVF